MDQEPKTIANSGYRVEPAKNGGFVLYCAPDAMCRGDQYAFTNEIDLLAFLKDVHTPARLNSGNSTPSDEPC